MKCAQKLMWIVFLVAMIQSSRPAAAQVTVSPSSAQVALGAQIQFLATGSSDYVVIWGISGAGCVGISCGEIDGNGLYIAPATAPNPNVVTITATSLADVTKVGSATVTIGAPASLGVTISPTAATIPVNGTQQFSADVTGSTNTAVTWKVSGGGTISSAGLYTAPAAVPSPATATVTVTTVATPAKSASATVTIETAASISVSVSPSTAQVSTGGQQQFTAKVTGTTNTSVNWSLSGCSGSACGSISSSGLYTAPSTVPSPPTVTITAASAASPSHSGSAVATIAASSSGLTISPSSPHAQPGAQIQFTASGPDSGVVLWSATGSGCAGITCGSINSSGLYTAPATVPNPGTVLITATSLTDLSITGTTTVTVGSTTQVSISVSPSSVELGTGADQQFSATVTGNSNTAVTWSLSGFGCAGSTCGTITTGGLYTAPVTPPNPSFVSVTATSVADPTKSSTATATISEKITVSVSPSPVQLAIGASQQFTAKVTGTGVTDVTWTLSGSGCVSSACGIISPAGLYTAPDTVPTPAQVTVTATSTADSATSGSATVNLIVPIQVAISPSSTIVTIGNQQQFQATVTGSTNTAVTWSLSGTGCTGSACGTITSAGLYTAPAKVPSPATVTVKATSKASASATAVATVTIALNNNSKLNGQYAFLFTGFDGSGVSQAAGTFTADGQGTITTGLEDTNNTAGPNSSVSISGTYQISADNRGVMTINGALGTQTFRFSLNQLGTKGRLISFDNSGIRGSGEFDLQDPTAFDVSQFVGGYVFDLTGMDWTNLRIGALGLVFPDGVSFISGSSFDVNDGGNVYPTFPTFSGIYSVDDTTGRGTATFSIPGFAGGEFDFAFYIVSANRFLMISTDPLSFNNPIFAGPAVVQNGAPFLNTTFNGESVFSLSGVDASGAPDDTVGNLNFSGGENATMIFDQNDAGNVTVAAVQNGAFSMELNGRGTLTLADPSTGAASLWTIYAYAPNGAFILDAATAAVAVGQMDPEQIIPPFANANIVGTYLFGSGEPIEWTTPLVSGIGNFDGGNSNNGQGNVAGVEDLSGSSTLSPSLGLSGTYSVSGVSNNGRGAILLTSPAGKTIAVWVTSGSQVVGLNIDSTTPEPTLLYFEQ